MDVLWWLLIAATVVGYPLLLVRCALRGHQWARDTLEAMRYVGGDLMTSSTWLSLPPEVPSEAESESSRRCFLA